jgi:threonine/homoserine/homoserine lactone efflux protein
MRFTEELEMHLAHFYMAILAGLAIAAPVGPIGIICIKRTLDFGFARGFASGLGAAMADGCYGLIAAVSMTSALAIISPHANLMNVCAAILLFKIGIDTFRTVPKEASEAAVENEKKGLLAAFFSTLFLTMLNPMTMMSFIAVFAAVGVKELEAAKENTLIIVFGVFLGSLIWWLFLCALVSKVREKLSKNSMGVINRISGLVVICFGFTCLSKLAHH